jgi:hypothetical protein
MWHGRLGDANYCKARSAGRLKHDMVPCASDLYRSVYSWTALCYLLTVG